MSSPIKLSLKTEWFSVALIILSLLSAVYFYQNFPAQVPTHWNFQGEVNGYSGPLMAAFIIPIMMIGLYLLFLALPYLDPKKDDYASFAGVYHKFKDLIITFLFILFLMTSLNGLGYKINMGLWSPLLVGLLFVLIGLMLDKVKMNWFLGIRTPWTLSSPSVWEKTHKMSGRVLILAGLLMALTVVLPDKLKITGFILAIALIIFALPIYSYWLYRQENKK